MTRVLTALCVTAWNALGQTSHQRQRWHGNLIVCCHQARLSHHAKYVDVIDLVRGRNEERRQGQAGAGCADAREAPSVGQRP